MAPSLSCWKCFIVANDKSRDPTAKTEEEFDREQSKHAVAVAAATAAAADAAVIAAESAIAVVRLTAKPPSNHRQVWAAIKIQSAFRAHLAKKALRALKALVKMQALVKGHLVRKQAVLALQSMQALMRIQTQKIPSNLEIQMPRSSQSTPRSVAWSECNTPSYMASTESFMAKLRCQSVPKQRMGVAVGERVVGPRGSVGGGGGVGREAAVSLSAVSGRMDRFLELSNSEEDGRGNYCYMRRRW